jgi:hypothetical protein
MANYPEKVFYEAANVNQQTFLNETVGYETLTISTNALGLASIPADARYAFCIVESDHTNGPSIRFLTTGSDPSGTDGMPRNANDTFDLLSKNDIDNFKVIRDSGHSGSTMTLHVTYYK